MSEIKADFQYTSTLGKKNLSGFKNQLKLKVLTCNMVSLSPTKITDKMAHSGNSSKP